MTTKIISHTQSVCPVCLKKIDAQRVLIGNNIYLNKTCPEHGDFSTIIWRGTKHFDKWNHENDCTPPRTIIKHKDKGCPFDCGVCSEHKQQACCVLIEVTKRCNQNCPVCYANSGENGANDPALKEITDWFKYLLSLGEKRPFNIQLSGGEPTVRGDLPEIIKIGRDMGFPYIQLNTNGKRLAQDEDYVRRLKEAGLSAVFLQFDGTDDSIYEKIRGKKLLELKIKAIDNCIKYQLGTVLVPTLVPGINTGNIGKIINFAIERLPVVRGVHFQPVSYFGKYPKTPENQDRITLPEVMEQIELQTNGKIKAENFGPLLSGNTFCSFKGSFNLQDDGSIKPLSYGGSCCGIEKESIMKARDFVLNKWVFKGKIVRRAKTESFDFSDMDEYIQRLQNYSFTVTGMAFQDAWNLDLERLARCTIHIFDAAKKELIPFCAYNLTDIDGNAIYRR